QAVPAFVPVQGILTDAQDAVVDGSIDVTFTIYNDDGIIVWDETFTLDVESGFFSVALGSGNVPLDLTIFRDNTTPSLGIKVGSDPEMSPRLDFGSVPYAVRAEYAFFAANSAQVGGMNTAQLDQR